MEDATSSAISQSQATAPRAPSDHALVGSAVNLPVPPATPTLSVSPLIWPASQRPFDLQLHITAPTTGRNLPVILLSQGHGQSNDLSLLNGYGPLVNFLGLPGFVVVQPTHLSSKSLGLPPDTPGAPLYWRSRVEDLKLILDHLADLEAEVPQITGRLDHAHIAVVGHS